MKASLHFREMRESMAKNFGYSSFKDTLKDVHSNVLGHDILPYFLRGIVNAFCYAYLLSVFKIL